MLPPIFSAIEKFGESIGRTLAYVASLPPSKGYEPYLVEQLGRDPIPARGIAKIAVMRGRRIARESKQRREIIDAVRFLAKPGRRRDAFEARANAIVKAWRNGKIVGSVFGEFRLDEGELVGLLEAFVKGDPSGLDRITQIAAAAAPALLLRRGPKVSAPSAAHEFMLSHVLPSLIDPLEKEMPRSRRKARSEEYVDPLTVATRLEFNVPDFDPRPARRRIKRQKMRAATSPGPALPPFSPPSG